MRTVVFDSNVVETEVKPHGKLDIFRKMLSDEVRDTLAVAGTLHPSPCPACAADDGHRAFEKSNLGYFQCGNCSSLYVSPRPTDAAIIDFYRRSLAWKFWREQILPETRATRRSKIFYPRARWLLDVCDKYQPDAERGVAVGYHSDLLLDVLHQLEPNLFHVTVTNPIADIEWAGIEIPGVSVQPMAAFDFSELESIDILLAFDFIDRCADLETFFGNVRKSLKPNGLFVASTILTGFDVWMLWDRSENIYPPDRLNLFSINGLKSLSQRHGFEILELSTPGMFDADSVRRAIEADPGFQWPRFMRYLFETGEPSTFHEFQEFLQKHRLSSFGRIVLRKTMNEHTDKESKHVG
jgi:SAM-dependent methyltransferase